MSTARLSYDNSPTDSYPSDVSSLSRENYVFLQRYIQAESGIVLDEDKHYLIEARLLPILRQEAILSLNALCALLMQKPSSALAIQVIEAMTTNETLFFRDEPLFEALRLHLLPQKLEAVRGRRKVRIWSAAASTGQEAYSVAILLLEAGVSASDVEIVGTDISEQVLARARLGRYVQFEVSRGLPGSLLMKYFVKIGLDWQIIDSVRSMVQFQQMDLRRSFDLLGTWDLILCRNVLIYFDINTKKDILYSMKKAMTPTGTLVLGCAETMISVDESFLRSVVGQSTVYSVL